MAELIISTGDAHVDSYTRTFDRLELRMTMWDDSSRRVLATGVVELHDSGTWDCDGIIRIPDLDADGLQGFGIVDTDGVVTLSFSAQGIDVGDLR